MIPGGVASVPPPPANDSHWGIGEAKKLLQTIKNSKYASCNSYIIIVILLTCYFHTMQIRQEQAGGVDVDRGVEEEIEDVEGGDTITILFLNSMYILYI